MSRTLLVIASAAALAGATAAPAVTFASGAAAASASASIGTVASASAAIGTASGGGGAYSTGGTVASAGQSGTLIAASALTGGIGIADALGATAITTAAYSTGPSAATGGVTVASLTGSFDAGLGLLTLADLGIAARAISSITTAGIDANGLYATGLSSIGALSIDAGLLGRFSYGAAALADPAANTLLVNLPTLTVTLNEQLRTTRADGIAMSTNALHIALNDYVLGGQAYRGDLILGHSEASVGGYAAPSGAVPEPASWAMMVGGFGLLGSALRRSKRSLALG